MVDIYEIKKSYNKGEISFYISSIAGEDEPHIFCKDNYNDIVLDMGYVNKKSTNRSKKAKHSKYNYPSGGEDALKSIKWNTDEGLNS